MKIQVTGEDAPDAIEVAGGQPPTIIEVDSSIVVPGASGVSSVNGITPDGSGNVTLTAGNVGADASGAASTAVSAHLGATDPHGDRADASSRYVPLTDSRLSDARTPTAHAASHGSAGSDPVTVAQSQVSGLAAALAALLPLAGGTLTGGLNGTTFTGSGTSQVQNLRLGPSGNFGGAADGALALQNIGTAPTGNPTQGVVAYAQGGVLKVRQSDGTIVTLANGLTQATADALYTSIASYGNVWTPSDHGLTAWSFDPACCSTTGTTLSAGFIYLLEVVLRKAATISKVNAVIGAAGSGLTSGQCLAGLYDSSGNRVAITADMSTTWASTGSKAMPLTSSYSAAAGRYYVALLFNGTTSPTFACGSTLGANFTPGNANLGAGSYRFCRSASGQTSLPTSVTLSGYTPDANNVWVGTS